MSMDIAGIYIAVAVVLLFLAYILRVATDIRTEARLTNGRVTSIEEWKRGFVQLSQERHDGKRDELGKHDTRLDRLEQHREREREREKE